VNREAGKISDVAAASARTLAVLWNMAFNKHQDLGRPVDEATIAREMKDTFRKLLLQVLEATTKEDIDTLYEAVEKGEIK
jgi:hypothetical protein